MYNSYGLVGKFLFLVLWSFRYLTVRIRAMNLLLTNDDGFDAPGLQAAYNALRDMGTVHVVAPITERSTCSHTITLRNPITVERRSHHLFGTSFAVDGTPADCVRLASATLLEHPIHLVVAGINRGANAGVDTFYSGTVAGAREGAILGMNAVAVSQAIRTNVETDWSAAQAVTTTLIKQLVKETLPGPGFWSINLPAPIPTDPEKHVHRVGVAVHPMPMSFDRSDHDDGKTMEFGYGASYWLRDVSGPSDYSVIRDGGIAVTAIPLVGRF